jgi:hypothetical protein
MRLVFEIYSQSLKFLQKHPIAFVFPLVYVFPNFIKDWLVQNNADLIFILLNFLSLAIGVVLALYIVVHAFKDNKILESNDATAVVIWKYFWKALGLGVSSLFVMAVLFSPLFFLVYYFSLSNIRCLQIFLLVVLLFGITFISLGVQSLALRIMLRYSKDIIESLMAGLKEVFHYFRFYFMLYLVSAFLSFFPIVVSLFIGTAKTGVSLFSSPIASPWEFLDNYQAIMSNSGAEVIRMFVTVLTVPLNHAAVTLAYINRKS